jgi:DNA mismatch endonuclease (patch repair protein)
MADCFEPEQRSYVMRQVRSARTGPEMRVRSIVRSMGRGYRLGGMGLPGKPDLVLTRDRKAIFVHGCFWHGHDCRRGARTPATNQAYWLAKIARNRARDEAATEQLCAAGWKPIIIWECELKSPDTVTLRIRTS